MKIYVAGKITGLARQAVLDKFGKAGEALAKQGHEVFVPCVLPDYPDVSRDDYLHVCFAMIDICDAVYFLGDWTASQCAIQELKYAAKKDKAILWEDKNEKEASDF